MATNPSGPGAAQTSGPGNPPATEPEAPKVSDQTPDVTGSDDDGKAKTLVVTAPFYQSAIQFPEGDGVIRFDRDKGTEVPADKVDEYKKRAKDAGVTLSVKKQKG